MAQLTIRIREQADALAEVLAKTLERGANGDGPPDRAVTLTRTEGQGFTALTLSCSLPEPEGRRCLAPLAAAAGAEHVLTCREPDIVERLLAGQFGFLDDDIRGRLRASLPRLLTDSGPLALREKLVLLAFWQYFLSEGDVHLEGFLQFRLRRYWEYLSFLLIRELNEIFRADARAELAAFLPETEE